MLLERLIDQETKKLVELQRYCVFVNSTYCKRQHTTERACSRKQMYHDINSRTNLHTTQSKPPKGIETE
jgi:hypothetical protein